jgi:DNA repair protein RadC
MISNQSNFDDELEPHYHGHRARLRARLRSDEGASLADYELLEVVLYVVPRRDMRPVAKSLLAAFGSLGGVVAAPRGDLRMFDGLNDTSIDSLKAIREAARRVIREEAIGRPVLSAWDKVIAYVRAELAHEQTERFYVLFLDRKNALIRGEERGRGTVDHAPVYPREIVKRALELSASALILVHNHPSGDTTPSRADIDITRDVAKACAAVGIALHDHLVVSRSGHASLRALGLI